MAQRISVTLADDKTYSLRYPMAAIKRIKQKYAEMYPPPKENGQAALEGLFLQNPVMQALTKIPEQALPYIVWEGLSKDAGLTEEIVANELIDGPMQEEVTIKVIEAFFGRPASEAFASFESVKQAAVKKIIDAAVDGLTQKETPATVQ